MREISVSVEYFDWLTLAFGFRRNKSVLSLRRGIFRRWIATPPVPSSSGRYQPGLFSGAKREI
jgi:hypothetical protein